MSRTETTLQEFIDSIHYASVPRYNYIDGAAPNFLLNPIIQPSDTGSRRRPRKETIESIDLEENEITRVMNLVNKYSKSFYNLEFTLCNTPVNSLYTIEPIKDRISKWMKERNTGVNEPFALVLSTANDSRIVDERKYIGNMILIFYENQYHINNDILHMFVYTDSDFGIYNTNIYDERMACKKNRITLSETEFKTRFMTLPFETNEPIEYDFDLLGFAPTIIQPTVLFQSGAKLFTSPKAYYQYSIFELQLPEE